MKIVACAMAIMLMSGMPISFGVMAGFIFMLGILFGIWFSRWGYHYTEELTRCTFRLNTGLPCPGCGGTRAFILFFRGELFLSFCYHPAVLTLAVCYLHFIILYLYRRFRHNKVTYRKEIPVQIYAYVFIGIVLLQWFVKLFLIYLKWKGHWAFNKIRQEHRKSRLRNMQNLFLILIS